MLHFYSDTFEMKHVLKMIFNAEYLKKCLKPKITVDYFKTYEILGSKNLLVRKKLHNEHLKAKVVF